MVLFTHFIHPLLPLARTAISKSQHKLFNTSQLWLMLIFSASLSDQLEAGTQAHWTLDRSTDDLVG